jgi:hypothetical protein
MADKRRDFPSTAVGPALRTEDELAELVQEAHTASHAHR